MRRYAILFALLTVVLAACRVETNFNIDISADGSAVVGAEVGFDEEFRQLMGEQGFSPEDIDGGLPDFGGEGVRPTNRTEGDMQFFGAEVDIDDLSAVNVSAPGIDNFSSFSYEFDDSNALLKATIDSQNMTGGIGDLPIDPGALASNFFTAHVIVKMPGSVTSSNADAIRSDGSLVWNIPLSGTVDIEATSDLGAETSLNFILLIVAAIVVLGLIGVIVWLVMAGRRRERAAVAAAAEAKAAAMAEQSGAGGEINIDLHPADTAEDQPDNT